MCKAYTGYCGTSEIEHGLCACTVDNPLAKARGLSLRTGAQTMLYLSLLANKMGMCKRKLWYLLDRWLTQSQLRMIFSHPLDKNIPFYRCLRFFYLGLLSQPRLWKLSQNVNHCLIYPSHVNFNYSFCYLLCKLHAEYELDSHWCTGNVTIDFW